MRFSRNTAGRYLHSLISCGTLGSWDIFERFSGNLKQLGKAVAKGFESQMPVERIAAISRKLRIELWLFAKSLQLADDLMRPVGMAHQAGVIFA